MESIILASSSPRRQEILKRLNIPFQVIIPNVDESFLEEKEDLISVPKILATRKIQGVLESLPKERFVPWILGCDTMILFAGKLLGKPKDLDEAREFLKNLQGNQHKVISSIALYNGKLQKTVTSTSITTVTFNCMSEKEIEWYLSTDEWHGAAGAYKIQGVAACFIKHIDGLESSVVGLPIHNLYDILTSQNYIFD